MKEYLTELSKLLQKNVHLPRTNSRRTRGLLLCFFYFSVNVHGRVSPEKTIICRSISGEYKAVITKV